MNPNDKRTRILALTGFAVAIIYFSFSVFYYDTWASLFYMEDMFLTQKPYFRLPVMILILWPLLALSVRPALRHNPKWVRGVKLYALAAIAIGFVFARLLWWSLGILD